MNQAIERNLFPLPRIGKTIQKLEGFLYATVHWICPTDTTPSPSLAPSVGEAKRSVQPYSLGVNMLTKGSQWDIASYIES